MNYSHHACNNGTESPHTSSDTTVENQELLQRARIWRDHDPDKNDRKEIDLFINQAHSSDQEVASRALQELTDRFQGPLTFGTAGLRGKMGAGSFRMNTAVVTCAAAGLVKTLRRYVGDDYRVIIGYDARYRSSDFARLSAGVIVADGGHAMLFRDHFPTPVTAYALKKLHADAAVMVTASHNPPHDNGYKVYLGGRCVTGTGQGAQIIPPWDERIHHHIMESGYADTIAVASSGWEYVPTSIIDDFIHDAAVCGQLSQETGSEEYKEKQGSPSSLRIVYTPMHGVGNGVATAALRLAGFSDIHEVYAQRDPDPRFPTVSFPNPEEPGALDLSLDTAKKIDADIVIANDPDADRCCAAIPFLHNGKRQWRQLTGDEIGVLLGEQIARAHRGQSQACLARSVVSSSMLDVIAREYGLQAAQTLTGFKWITRAPHIIFGYEEAIGYACDPEHVLDKDGVSAAVSLARLAHQCRQRHETIADHLDNLYRRFGLYMTAPLTFRVDDISLIAQGMKRLRETGGPGSLASHQVTVAVDMLNGYEGLPPTDGMVFATHEADRVIVRPSGTEPKLKCYLETVIPASQCQKDIDAARTCAQQRLESMKNDMRQALAMHE